MWVVYNEQTGEEIDTLEDFVEAFDLAQMLTEESDYESFTYREEM